ncbi:MAG: crossover junction endodeoxyribonuclease RuvC [Spirochaetales bacterium]|nr:crossover junction endodeoxyribonuclease RuvC [Spirochaetales bacterium]
MNDTFKKVSVKKYMGIDPGLGKTGYALMEYDGVNYHHIEHGVIETDRNMSSGKRLIQIYKGIKKIIAQYLPDEAAIETLYFAKNLKSAMPVAQARGVIIFTLTEGEVDYYEYSPLQVKLAVVGNGKAEKRQVQEMVKLICKLPEIPRPDHASDALAIAICHANYSFRNKQNSQSISQSRNIKQK